MTEKMFPSEVVELPSQGFLYPEGSKLKSGKVELYYPTAKSEDILTNQNYIEKGTVVDKFLQSLLVDESLEYTELLEGDKNALLLAARIMGYGKSYSIDYRGKTYEIDLSTVENKPVHEAIKTATSNEFSFTLPSTGIEITFKLLTHEDITNIEQEIAGLKKLYKDKVSETSVRYWRMITSVDGKRDQKDIREFVEKRFLTLDTRAFRKYVVEIQPDINFRFYPENGPEGGVQIPMGISFLWPDVEL